MELTDPISVYKAENNQDARMAQLYLDAGDIKAVAIEDNSVIGNWWGGTLPGVHNSQVWVHRRDAERARVILAQYVRRKIERKAANKAKDPQTIEVQCEECDKVTSFAGQLKGTVQECRHCGSYVDVVVSDDSDKDIPGDTQTDGDVDQ